MTGIIGKLFLITYSMNRAEQLAFWNTVLSIPKRRIVDDDFALHYDARSIYRMINRLERTIAKKGPGQTFADVAAECLVRTNPLLAHLKKSEDFFGATISVPIQWK